MPSRCVWDRPAYRVYRLMFPEFATDVERAVLARKSEWEGKPDGCFLSVVLESVELFRGSSDPNAIELATKWLDEDGGYKLYEKPK